MKTYSESRKSRESGLSSVSLRPRQAHRSVRSRRAWISVDAWASGVALHAGYSIGTVAAVVALRSRVSWPAGVARDAYSSVLARVAGESRLALWSEFGDSDTGKAFRSRVAALTKLSRDARIAVLTGDAVGSWKR